MNAFARFCLSWITEKPTCIHIHDLQQQWKFNGCSTTQRLDGITALVGHKTNMCESQSSTCDKCRAIDWTRRKRISIEKVQYLEIAKTRTPPAATCYLKNKVSPSHSKLELSLNSSNTRWHICSRRKNAWNHASTQGPIPTFRKVQTRTTKSI